MASVMTGGRELVSVSRSGCGIWPAFPSARNQTQPIWFSSRNTVAELRVRVPRSTDWLSIEPRLTVTMWPFTLIMGWNLAACSVLGGGTKFTQITSQK